MKFCFGCGREFLTDYCLPCNGESDMHNLPAYEQGYIDGCANVEIWKSESAFRERRGTSWYLVIPEAYLSGWLRGRDDAAAKWQVACKAASK